MFALESINNYSQQSIAEFMHFKDSKLVGGGGASDLGRMDFIVAYGQSHTSDHQFYVIKFGFINIMRQVEKLVKNFYRQK